MYSNTLARSQDTVLAAVAGGLGAIWYLSRKPPNKADTAASRRETLQKIQENQGVFGFVELGAYLSQDGFAAFKYIPPKTTNTPFQIGSGPGLTRWPHLLDSLRAFSEPGGGTTLAAAVDKAITYNPAGDDPFSRGLVLKWLEGFATAGDPGFAQLYSDLNGGNWPEGYTPGTPPPPITLTISVGEEKKTLLDYPHWLGNLKTAELVETVDALAYPTDPTATERYLLWLRVALAQKEKYPGFDEFAKLLDAGGWSSHPFDKKPPPPGTVLKVLGGLQNVDVSALFENFTVAGIGPTVDRAISSYDPTALARHQILISLVAVQLDPWAPQYFEGFNDLYRALDAGGFGATPRGQGLPFAGRGSTSLNLRGFEEAEALKLLGFKTVGDLVDSATPAQIGELLTLGARSPGPKFRRWVALQTFKDPVVLSDKIPTGLDPTETINTWIQGGVFSRVPVPPVGPDLEILFNLADGSQFGSRLGAYDVFSNPASIDYFVSQLANTAVKPGLNEKIAAPHFHPTIAFRVAAGQPAIGIPGATWGNYGVNYPS